MLTDSVSRQEWSARLGDALPLPPFLEQGAPPPRIAPLLHPCRRDAVGAEMAKVLAQLAPGGQHPDLLEKGKGEGPDRPLASAARLVLIGVVELALEADRLAERAEIDR